MKRFILLSSVFCLLSSVLSGTAFSAPPERIISLAPSVTEILYALGLEDKITAVTNFCDYPPQAKKKPKIGGMSNPSLEAVLSMKPDIVVMTTDGNPKEIEERLKGLGIKTYVFKARQLFELPQGIRDMGEVLGVKEEAHKLAREIETKLKKSEVRSQKSEVKRKALFIVWTEPLLVAGPGTAIDDALQLLGWKNIASDTKTKYPKYSIEEVINRSPDVILIGKSMGADMKESSKGLLKKLKHLEAVKNGRVYYTGDALYRLGPRIVEGIEEMAGYLNRSQKSEARSQK
ncbi:MAG: cobalamin-binding protein [Nitrospinae bacterium]|nr:cobalamin-binding protein [Nitrospinota bacterium]MBI3814470.1 cobalamin-binding protein [Nitrospinota bacterium]